jgi:hypothetical protein
MHLEQFRVLIRQGRPLEPNKNREFFLDNRELKFPDLHSSSEKLQIFFSPCREKRPKFPTTYVEHYLKQSSQRPGARLVASMVLLQIVARAISRKSDRVIVVSLQSSFVNPMAIEFAIEIAIRNEESCQLVQSDVARAYKGKRAVIFHLRAASEGRKYITGFFGIPLRRARRSVLVALQLRTERTLLAMLKSSSGISRVSKCTFNPKRSARSSFDREFTEPSKSPKIRRYRSICEHLWAASQSHP